MAGETKKKDDEEKMEEDVVEHEDSCSGSEESEGSGCSEDDSSGSEEETEGSVSEWETDAEEGSDEEDADTAENPGTSNSQSSGDVDEPISESDGESEKCPICLAKIADQGIGTPESCDHDFCLECIQEWAKNVNTCPVDRQVFNLILAKHSAEGTVYKRIPVKDNQLEVEEEYAAEADTTVCEVCGESNREDRLLLCDGCDLAYHCECLPVPLASVPRGMWFCPDCAPTRRSNSRRDAPVPESGVIMTGPRDRFIGRTLVSERVRAIIANAREERARARQRYRRVVALDDDDEEYQASDMETEDLPASVSRPKPRTPKKKRTPKKRKTTRKRKTKRKTTKKRKTKAKTSKDGSTTTPKRKRKRKRKRKSTKKARTKSVVPKTAKTRIADRLGIKKPPTGRSIPTMREATHRSLDDMRYSIGITGLSILGSRDDLDPYLHSSEDEGHGGGGGGGVAVARAPVPRHGPHITKAALASRLPIRAPVRLSTRTPAAPTSCGGSFDLLGDIMQGQNLLNTSADKIIIKRDGSLTTSSPTSPKKAPRNGLVKNPGFSSSHSEPKDGDDGEKGESGGGGGGGSSGDNNGAQQQQSPTGSNSRGEGLEVSAAGSQEGQGSSEGNIGEDDDHLFESGDLCIDSSADEKSQDDDDKKAQENKDKTAKEEEELYNPEEVTPSDDDKPEQKEDMYDPMEATADSEPVSPSNAAAKHAEEELYDPMDVTQSDDEEKVEERSDIYDPTEGTEASDADLKPEDAEPVVQDLEGETEDNIEDDVEEEDDNDNEVTAEDIVEEENDKDDDDVEGVAEDIVEEENDKDDEDAEDVAEDNVEEESDKDNEDNEETAEDIVEGDKDNTEEDNDQDNEGSEMIEDTDKLAEDESEANESNEQNLSKDSNNPEVDEETSKVVSAISDILKLEEEKSESPFKSYDKAESPASLLKEQSENAQMPPSESTQGAEALTMEATGEESDDCPTPVADENGPESPDPETQNPENFAFSRTLNSGGGAGGSGEQSDDNSTAATPNIQNDVTPNLSPITDSEIPLAKQGARTPEQDTTSKASSFPQGGEWEVKGEEGFTDSEEEEFHRRFMPVSELPRIPKKKQPPAEVIVIDDEDSPVSQHKSVLEKVNVKEDSYRWEGKSRHRDRSREKRRRSSDSDERHSRHRRHREDDSDDGRRDRKKKHRRRSRSRSKGKSRDRDRSRRSRSREKRKSRRGRSRSRERKRSRSRDRKRRSRSRTPKRKDKHRDRDRSREKKKRDRDRRSPSRDRFGRSVPNEYKASIKSFSQAIKEAATPESGRKFKLKRNFYNDLIDGDNSSDVPLPADPPKKKEEKSRREKDREERGGWHTPSPTPEQKIETVVNIRQSSGGRPKEPPVFQRNEAFDSDSSLSSDEEDLTPPISASKTNNIAIRTEEKSPVRLYSNYDPSDPTEEAASPPIPPDEKEKTPPPIPCLGSPHRTGAMSHQDPQQQAASLMFTGSPLSLDPLRPSSSGIDMIREPPPGLFNPESPIRPQGAGMMLRTPLGLVQHPGGQVMVNPLLGPPPPFGTQFPGGPPPQFPGGPPPPQGGRLQTPGFIQLPGGQRVPVSQNGMPIQQQQQQQGSGERGGGMMLEGLPPGMHPVLPDTRLPPPSSTATSMPSQTALPAKALEQMQQISNLLNAQAKLAQFVPNKAGGKSEGGEGQQQQQQSQQQQQPGSLLGAPPAGLKPLDRNQPGMFKVPLPPGPPMNSGKDSSSESGKKTKKGEETTEVVDMDVASPFSDDEVGINISFSPPLRKRSRRSDRDADKKKNNSQQNSSSSSDNLENKVNEVFGKQQKSSTTTMGTRKKKERAVNVKFNLEKKPSALVKPSKAVTKPPAGSDDVPTSAVELDKQQKFLKKLNRQERVVEEVKLAIKPHYAAGKISKTDYKEIMRKAVPKICHSKSGDINPEKIRNYVLAYVNKTRQLKKYEQKQQVKGKPGGGGSKAKK